MSRGRSQDVSRESFLGLARALRPEARSILDLAPVSGDLVVSLLEACRGARYLGLFPDAAVLERALRRLRGFDPEPSGRVAPAVLDEPWGKSHDLLIAVEPLPVQTDEDQERLGAKAYESLIDGGACLLAASARLPDGPVGDAVLRFEGTEGEAERGPAPGGADLLYRVRRAGFRQAEIVMRRGTRIVLAAVR